MAKQETINWTAGSGQEIEVGIELITSRDINADGHIVTVPCEDYRYSLKIDGKEQSGIYGIQPIDHPVAVAMIGNVGITKDNYKRIDNALRRLSDHPEAVEYRNSKSDNKRTTSAQDVYNTMTINGTTY